MSSTDLPVTNESSQVKMSSTDLPATNENDARKIGKMGIRISSLPQSLRETVATLKLDQDGDGALDEEEVAMAVDSLASKIKHNAGLKKMVWGLAAFSFLLIGCVFGATIAAARLAKDTEVDPISGIMFTKGGNQEVLRTEGVIIYSIAATVADMSNSELDTLKDVQLSGGDIKFQIKGYARSIDLVKLLVEGGTITYDITGIVNATGDAKDLLEFVFGELETVEERSRRRYLANGGEVCYKAQSGSTARFLAEGHCYGAQSGSTARNLEECSCSIFGAGVSASKWS
jgi:hypothetical protein